MTKSMTGFASASGAGLGYSWGWEIRAVNARGMDARLRLPDWIDGLEVALRAAIQKKVARGNVSLTLKVGSEDMAQGVAVNAAALNGVLSAIKHIQDCAARDHDLQLRATSAADILAMRAIGDASRADQDTAALLQALTSDFASLLRAFDAMRKNEGAVLHKVLAGRLDQIEILTTEADSIAKGRQEATAQTLRDNLARVLDNSDGAHADRVAQELARRSVKSDVTEEIDRLHSHVTAARGLLDSDGQKGRKLDFLTQEFNREANTLCSKAQANELTRVGLDLKAVIEQLREQVQNVE